ncbi:MAG: hypothetical protein GXO07_02090 [Crenarchaeota archaeon]|nr:hypothetical protein [Thermoproteota archaeon]
MKALRAFSCGHWRVLFLDGEPKVVVVDSYSPEEAGEEVLTSEEAVLWAKRTGEEVQGISTEGTSERIFIKYFVEEFEEPEKYLERALGESPFPCEEEEA